VYAYQLGGVRVSFRGCMNSGGLYYDVNRSVRCIRPGPPDLTRWEGKLVLQATVLAARDPASFGSKAGRPINDFQVRGRSALSGHENPFKGSITPTVPHPRLHSLPNICQHRKPMPKPFSPVGVTKPSLTPRKASSS
jgi:hypothetical protein